MRIGRGRREKGEGDVPDELETRSRSSVGDEDDILLLSLLIGPLIGQLIRETS